MKAVLLNEIIDKAMKLKLKGEKMKTSYFPLFGLFMFLMLFGNAFAQNSGAANSIQKDGEEKIYKQSEVDQKAEIIKRFHPSNDRMCSDDSGLVRVLVVLHKSGKVGDVKPLIISECQRFNENSFTSAKKIKFKPALKYGETVSVSVMIEFKYNRY